jgi:hypothetical protein
MLGQLTELETAAQGEEAKTARANLALQNTLLSTLGKIEVANLGAQGSVLAARMGFFETRAKQLNDEVLKNGPREISDLGTAPRTSIGTVGGFIKDGAVKPGNEAAFANEVVGTIDQLSATDPRLVAVYRDEIKKEYGVDIGAWFAGKQGDSSLGLVANSLIPKLQQGQQAQIKSQEVIVGATEELGQIAKDIMVTPGVSPGSSLSRAVREYSKGLGINLPELGGSGLPAKEGEGAATGTAAPAGGGVATKEARTTGLRPYLGEQRDLILKELDRLENSSDPESVRLREKLMASPAIAQWAANNGYADYRPDQQFKAALAYRRKALRDQDAAFNAQLESDILSGEAGTALGRTGVKIKRFLTGETARRDRTIEVEEGLTEVRRRKAERGGAKSAEIVGGATGPSDAAPTVPESAPTTTTAEPSPPPAGMKEKPAETVEAAIAEEPSLLPEDGGPFAEYAPGSVSNMEFGRARGRNELAISTYLRQKKGVDPEVQQKYTKAQAYKATQPTKYAETLQELVDKIKSEKSAPQVTPMSQDQLMRDWENQRRPSMETPESEKPMTEAPKPEEPPMPTVPAPTPTVPTEAPMPEGEEAGGMGDYEMAPADEAFLAQLGKASSVPTTAKAPNIPSAPSAVAAPSQPSSQSTMGSRTAEVKAPMFQSFGAEAATASAGNAMAAYQQLEEDTRRRRAALLRGGLMNA